MGNDKPEKMIDFLDVIFSELEPQEKLKKLGISREELDIFLKAFIPNKEPYYRVFTKDDQRALTAEAYQYLYELLKMRSINRDLFEKIFFFAIHISEILNQKVNKKGIDDIINFVIFSGQNEITLDDLLDLYLNDNNYDN
jgi:hypothetical protein